MNTEIGYRGQSIIDTGYFFAPYRPGMTADEISEVNEQIAEACKPPTELQRRIMDTVKGNLNDGTADL